MKTAILVSGQCRTLDLCFENIKAQVLRYLPQADLWISVAQGPDAGQAQLLATAGLKVRLLETVEQPVLNERDYQHRAVGGHYCPGEGPWDLAVVQRILRQAWHLRRVYEAARDSGENYDAFVRLRPDQWFVFGIPGLPDITPPTAAVPWWGRFGGVNDRFAILGREAAEAYCWWPHLDRWLASGSRFHPESLTQFALDRAQARIVYLPALCATLKRDPLGQIVVRQPEILGEEIAIVSEQTFQQPAANPRPTPSA